MRLLRPAWLFLILSALQAPASASLKRVPYHALNGTVDFLVADSLADLPATGPSNGVSAYVISESAVYCFESGSWSACSSVGGGSGTVTSVSLSPPGIFTLSGSPITTSGTFTLGLATQTANTVWAGPTTGSAAAPAFRALVVADLPAHLVFDVGDDGGNDSVALGEIATLHDDYGVWPESSSDKALFDFAKVPPYQQYDPNRPPSTCGTGGVCDEFTGGVTMTFNGWQNQESSTATAERDGLTLCHPTDLTGVAVYWFTGPDGSTTDWVFHVRVSTGFLGSFNQAGIVSLLAGTEASPTSMRDLAIFQQNSSTVGSVVRARSYTTSYTSNSAILTDKPIGGTFAYLAIGYVSSTKAMTFYVSEDGHLYVSLGSQTLGAHPTTSFGLMVGSISSKFQACAAFQFVRVRTDADRANPGE